MITYDSAKAYERYLERLPTDARERLSEPSDESLTPDPSGRQARFCLLPADNPATDAGRFVQIVGFDTTLEGRDARLITRWSSLPTDTLVGGGWGFGGMTGRPRLAVEWRSALQPPDVWWIGPVVVASPRAANIFRTYASSAIEIIDIDLTLNDRTQLEGYVLVDVVATRHSTDYSRSDIEVYLREDRRYFRVGRHRTLRSDIPPDIHAFRDALEPRLFVSRELAMALEPGARGWLLYLDEQCTDPLDFNRDRIVEEWSQYRSTHAPKPAPASQAALPDEEESVSLEQAEQQLLAKMRSLEPTPFHVICDLDITTSRAETAQFFDTLVQTANAEREVKIVYSEMNCFAINPEWWFFDVLAYDFDGGRHTHDWLCEYFMATDAPLLIEGLEPLQQVFADWLLVPQSLPELKFHEAHSVAQALVIVKFQRLLAEARPLMRNVTMPLLATARDYYDCLAEIPGGSDG